MTGDNRTHVQRRSVLKTLGVTASALTLAGCSEESQTSDDGDDGDDGTSTPDETPVSGADLSNVEEGVLAGGAVDAGLLPFTKGVASVLGLQTARGAELAVEYINDNGGIGGEIPIELSPPPGEKSMDWLRSL